MLPPLTILPTQAPLVDVTPPIPLDQGWTQHSSKDGRTFWHNSLTNKSSWDKPDCLKTELELLMSYQTPWKEYTTADGRIYWFNKETKKSVWECPEDVQQLKQELSGEWISFTDKTVAIERIKTLFKLKNLGPRARWEDALNAIKNDSRFSCFNILSSGQKKQAFAEFLNQHQKYLRDRDRTRKVEGRKIFLEELAKWPSLTPASLLSEFESCFKSEWWMSCIESSEKDDLFNEYIEEWEPTYWDKHRAGRKQQRVAILEFFRSSPKVNLDLTWRQVAEILLEQEDLKGAEPGDYLNCWEEYVHEAEQLEREAQRSRIHRSRRKRREVFRALIQRRIADGSLTARVSFVDFVELHHDHPAYLEVVGVPVATPREMFEEETEPLVDSYESQKQILKNILKSFDIRVTSSTTYDSFVQSLEASEDSKQISETNSRLFYDSLRRRALRREREKRDPEGSEERGEGERRHSEDGRSAAQDRPKSKSAEHRQSPTRRDKVIEESGRHSRSDDVVMTDGEASRSKRHRSQSYREKSEGRSDPNDRRKKRSRRHRSQSQ